MVDIAHIVILGLECEVDMMPLHPLAGSILTHGTRSLAYMQMGNKSACAMGPKLVTQHVAARSPAGQAPAVDRQGRRNDGDCWNSAPATDRSIQRSLNKQSEQARPPAAR